MTPLQQVKLYYIAQEIMKELERALSAFPPMPTAHDGYAVILEEIRELEHEVFSKERIKERMRKEALQTAAMAIRFINDVCDK